MRITGKYDRGGAVSNKKSCTYDRICNFSIFVMIALIVDGIKGVRIPVISAVIAIAFAATDEFHQTFVPGRYGCVLDVLIDAAGSIIGLIIVYIIYKNMCKHKGEKCNNIN